MKIATLGLVLRDDTLLLGEKKKGEIGIGRLSGPGGKLEEEKEETFEECLIRETDEEFHLELDPTSLEMVAYIVFHKGRTDSSLFNWFLNLFGLGGIPDFGVYVYRACLLPCQQLKETDDMIPGWYPLNNLPYEKMYEADRYWLLTAALGIKFCANVYYLGRAEKFGHIDTFPFKMNQVPYI